MIIIDSVAKRIISFRFFQEFCFPLLILLIAVHISESAVRARGESKHVTRDLIVILVFFTENDKLHINHDGCKLKGHIQITQ